jgi:MFS family permease
MQGISRVILASALFGGIGTVNYWLSQPYYAAAGIPIILFGVVFALIYLAGALASKLLSKVTTGWTAERVVLYGGIALGISSLLKSFVYDPILSVCVSLLAPMIMGLLSPTFQTLVHKSISSPRRATIYSINTLLTSLAFVALGPVFGALADSSLPLSFLVLSIVAVMTGLLFYILLSKNHAFKGRA